jgi:hypothetical protein
MAKTDFELYSKTRVYVYYLDTTLDKMVKYKKPRLGDKIGHLSYDLLTMFLVLMLKIIITNT